MIVSRRPLVGLRLSCPALALAGVMLMASPASATWSATNEGTGWHIRERDVWIAMPDERTARKTARRINKSIRQGEERVSQGGVVAPGSGSCNDPASGVLC